MHWQGAFRASFFDAWSDAGFPDPQAYLDDYRGLLAASSDDAPIPAGGDGPLRAGTIARTHGFGHALGLALGGLLGVDPAVSEERAGWCGRFNVGISLFDYVCDETARGDVLTRIPLFARLGGESDGVAAVDLRPEEEYLAGLAESVMAEFVDGTETVDVGEDLFAGMYRAEVWAAATAVDPAADLDAVEAAIRTKSAEPFAIMAVWMAAGQRRADVDTALRLGRAVGDCFWIIDDAKDLWVDIDSGAWNLFLVHAARQEPALLTHTNPAIRDVHISRMLEETNAAGRVSTMVIEELEDVVAELNTSMAQRDRALGLISAAASVW